MDSDRFRYVDMIVRVCFDTDIDRIVITRAIYLDRFFGINPAYFRLNVLLTALSI